MTQKYTMKLKDIAAEHELHVAHAAGNYDVCEVTSPDVARPS